MMPLVDWILDPLQFSFITRGLIAGTLVGVVCAVLGVFVVIRGMAFIGDALAHTVLPGVVFAFLMGFNLIIGAFVAGIITALSIGWFSKEGEVSEDTAIGILFSGLFALGIAMLSRIQSYQDLTHILFGNILGVSRGDLIIMGAVVAVVLVGIALFYKELVITSFDPGHAVAIGLSPSTIRYGLLILLVLAVVSGIQAVGVVLVVSLLVTPAAAASFLTKRLPLMMLLSVLISVFAAIVGLYVSYYSDISSGPVIVLTLTWFFILVYFFAPHRGMIWRMVSMRRT